VKIFGSEIHLDIIFSGNDETGSVAADLKVNNKVITNLVKFNFNRCTSVNSKNVDINKDILLFKADFPVFGIIIIKV